MTRSASYADNEPGHSPYWTITAHARSLSHECEPGGSPGWLRGRWGGKREGLRECAVGEEEGIKVESEVAASWLRPAVADSRGDLLSALVPVCSLSASPGEVSPLPDGKPHTNSLSAF